MQSKGASGRRSFLAGLASIFAFPQTKKQQKTWIVTTPFDFLRKEPRTIGGGDRLEALVNMGFTVWTEQEWLEAEKLRGQS